MSDVASGRFSGNSQANTIMAARWWDGEVSAWRFLRIETALKSIAECAAVADIWVSGPNFFAHVVEY